MGFISLYDRRAGDDSVVPVGTQADIEKGEIDMSELRPKTHLQEATGDLNSPLLFERRDGPQTCTNKFKYQRR